MKSSLTEIPLEAPLENSKGGCRRERRDVEGL